MTEPQATQPVSEIESSPAESPPPAEGDAGPPPAPEPEPWTPERVSEWNAYYDRYVMGAALLLALVVSCNNLTDPSVFLHLRSGELINERMAPVKTDEFSYTEAGRPWVDVPWLFQWSQAALYNVVSGAVPTDPLDPTANRGKADRIAIGALGLLDALVRLVAAWVLMKIRHRGPGLWWSAICVTLAVGAFYDPLSGIAPGGLASVPGIGGATSSITPAAWSHLFLALELLILFRALGQGRPAWLWGLVPLFVLWANCDVSFLTGLLLFAAVAVGHWLDGGASAWPEGVAEAEELDSHEVVAITKGDSAGKGGVHAARHVPPSRAFLVLALCALACLANPWTYQAYVVAATPFLRMIRPGENVQLAETLSFFSGSIRQQLGGAAYLWTILVAFYLIMLAVGLGSFLLNSARFSWRRFLPFALVSILWGCMIRYSAEFALVFAVVLALNGQEWYQARFGTRGRLGPLWTLWSTGGRLVTLALIFAMVGLDMTGRYIDKVGVHFGLGYNPDHFPMEAAEFLERQNELRGNVFNTSMEQGDLLLWKAYPKRKVFIDHRTNLFPRDLLELWDRMRKAIRDDNVEAWKPLLDQYKISAVMIEPAESRLTYQQLKNSPNWIPFYDDGRIVMFGRKDAPATDVAVFEANRLEPSRIYRATNPLPASEGPPTATSWIDDIFWNRSLDRTQRRTDAAARWLMADPAIGGSPGLPEPARCLLAIQDARIALSRNPDDPVAYRILNEAYRMLTLQETALLAGIPLTPENQARIAALGPSPNRLINRYRQRVTALNYAIQTTPTPTTGAGRNELFDLNMQLFELYAAANFRDLARDRLAAALALNPTEDHVTNETRIALQGQLNQLDQAIKQIDERMKDLEIEQQPRAVDLAAFARQQGAVGLAIERLAAAETSGDSTALVKPQLVDLYCNAGTPEKAMDLLNVGSIGDPNLGAEPGTATYRQGLVYYLLGNYLSTASLWGDRAIPQLRMERTNRALGAGKGFILGQAVAASNQFLSIPGNLEQQASWEFDLALCELEAGRPEEAAKRFANALTLEPDLATRPIAAYYLEKLGKPVPPKREAAGAGKAPAGRVNLGTMGPIPAEPTVSGTPAPTAPVPPGSGGDKAKAAAPAESKKTEEPKEGPK
jgi:tetratricopeptide (TPR) repeat protein